MLLLALLTLGLAEEADTSAIKKLFEEIKRKGTPVRVLATSEENPAYFRRSFELTSFNIEVTETGNQIIPYMAVVQFRAKVKVSKEFPTKEEAEKAPSGPPEDSYVEWKAIFRNVKGAWALENILYRNSSFQIWSTLKTTIDARHFVYDWFQALDGY